MRINRWFKTRIEYMPRLTSYPWRVLYTNGLFDMWWTHDIFTTEEEAIEAQNKLIEISKRYPID